MTKEQLESEFEDCHDNNTKATGGGYEADYTDKWGVWKAFSPKIDEYAKQQAIAFGIWIHKEGWVQSSDNLVTDNLWYHEDNDETYLTTQQLHDLFIEHQKQNNQ